MPLPGGPIAPPVNSSWVLPRDGGTLCGHLFQNHSPNSSHTRIVQTIAAHPNQAAPLAANIQNNINSLTAAVNTTITDIEVRQRNHNVEYTLQYRDGNYRLFIIDLFQASLGENIQGINIARENHVGGHFAPQAATSLRIMLPPRNLPGNDLLGRPLSRIPATVFFSHN